MQAQPNAPEYFVLWGTYTGQIRRRDLDGRSRMVATVTNEREWQTFQDSIEAGFDEVDAVKELDR